MENDAGHEDRGGPRDIAFRSPDCVVCTPKNVSEVFADHQAVKFGVSPPVDSADAEEFNSDVLGVWGELSQLSIRYQSGD